MNPGKRKLKFGEAEAIYKRDCEKCGCPLGFGETFDHKIIPLDLRAPVYCVTGEKGPGYCDGVVRTHMAFVSHFATCPHANEFSNKNKKGGKADDADSGDGTTDRE